MSNVKFLGGGQPDYPAALSNLQHMDSEQLKVRIVNLTR